MVDIIFVVFVVVIIINDKIQQQQQQKCIISKSLYILFYNILNSTLYMKHALESLIFNKISIGRKSGCRVYVHIYVTYTICYTKVLVAYPCWWWCWGYCCFLAICHCHLIHQTYIQMWSTFWKNKNFSQFFGIYFHNFPFFLPSFWMKENHVNHWMWKNTLIINISINKFHHCHRKYCHSYDHQFHQPNALPPTHSNTEGWRGMI